MLVMWSWSLVEGTGGVLVSSRAGRSTREVLRPFTSRIQLVMSLQPVWGMCSPLAREQSHGWVCPREEVLSYRSSRRPERGKQLYKHQPHKQLWVVSDFDSLVQCCFTVAPEPLVMNLCLKFFQLISCDSRIMDSNICYVNVALAIS